MAENNRPDKKQIEAWKKEHGKLYQITVDGFVIIFREPLVKDLERAMASNPKGNKKFNFNRSIIENCSLYKDENALATNQRTIKVFSELDELIPQSDAETKEL